MNTSEPVDVLYSDTDLVAVNKPAGLISIRDGYNPERSNVLQILSEIFGKLWVVHRLDADTSGVLLFARNPGAHRHLSLQFQHHAVKKKYNLLVFGTFDWQEKQVDWPLSVDGDRRHRTMIDHLDGKPASTAFQVIQRFGADYAMLSALPLTGYTHQIRAHCSTLGLWLLNDPLYFPRLYPPQPESKTHNRIELFQKTTSLPIARTSLHALSIQFEHPVTNQTLDISAPYPEDFSSTIKYLREKQP